MCGNFSAGSAASERLRRLPGARPPHPETPAEALEVLEEGNRRFRRGEITLRDYSPAGELLTESQKPFAAILTCSDSRLSSTLIFDLAHGNLFVSRVAGNSVGVATLGSTEYAVAVLGVKLVVVLGHSDCGAVKAALEVANGTGGYPPQRYGAIGELIDACVPPIEALPSGERSVDACIRANARAQAEDLASREPIIKPAVESGGLRVVAALYDIADGRVSLI